MNMKKYEKIASITTAIAIVSSVLLFSRRGYTIIGFRLLFLTIFSYAIILLPQLAKYFQWNNLLDNESGFSSYAEEIAIVYGGFLFLTTIVAHLFVWSWILKL